MADQKISQLTADATPTSDDLVVLVNDPGGTPGSRNCTLANLYTFLASLLPGRMLAYVSYNPGSVTDKTTTSTTGADVDATNLAITFTVPPSGSVLFVLTARCYQSAGNYYSWMLRTTGGANVAGTACMIDGNASDDIRKTHRFVLTGLTPGASLTYRWGFAVSAGTAHLLMGDSGALSPIAGPAVMEVYACL